MECSLVVVVVDVNPVWWGLQNGANDKGLTLFECMDHVLAFINSHVMMNQNNKVAVIASHTNESRFLYPGREADVKADDGGREVRDGKYEHFANINDTVQEEIRKLIVENPTVGHTDTLLAGSLAMGLCYIHRVQKACQAGQKINSRLLVIKAADDNASQYMNLMNVIFTAQKQSIPVDACILEKDSGLLQQACDITNGVYLQIPQINGLLQYLLWVFLPDPSLRETLVLPPSIHVDYRAACFCHRTLIDIGYVCSVCLSIFCTYSPICSTCHTAFKLKTAPVLRAKKKKKTSLPAT
ncbi:general transcription factor IIH subunit 3-like isoform X1 [Asterias rubens]|uniref:general transcription factor IIH subunit 3-like isoform X1 n=1 Tax=Asterias rubens TaxID=7604 RepID=UPI0014552D0A|nr:general transcription factor IIH subunit 3-like isoform X1 [Asterias rubens]